MLTRMQAYTHAQLLMMCFYMDFKAKCKSLYIAQSSAFDK